MLPVIVGKRERVRRGLGIVDARLNYNHVRKQAKETSVVWRVGRSSPTTLVVGLVGQTLCLVISPASFTSDARWA
jgi:hypothetical protein